jgi:hypothetical protein
VWELFVPLTAVALYMCYYVEREGLGRGFISEEVEVSEMDYDEDEGIYTHPCRCGEEYQVRSEADATFSCMPCASYV